MKFCTRCGCNMDDDVESCPECGMPQTSNPILNLDRRKGTDWMWLYGTLIVSGAVIFCLTYFLRFYLMLFFFPIFFLGGLGRRGKVEYALQGLILGAILGYMAAVVILLVQNML